MSGTLQVLFVILLSVALGAAALIYFIWKRRRSSQGEPALKPQGSTNRDGDTTALGDRRDGALFLKRRSRDEAAGTPDESVEDAVKHDDGTTEHDGAEQRQLAVAPDKEPVEAPITTATPDAVDQEETFSAGRPEPESTLLQPESGNSVTPEIAGTTSGETADTDFAEEEDRLQEEQTSVDAADPDEAKGTGSVVAAAGAISTKDDEQSLGPAAEDEGDKPDRDPTTTSQLPRSKRARKRKPRKYKGLARAAPGSRDAALQPGPPGAEEPGQRERSLPIEVRLRFDRGGFCNLALIAKRSAGLPEVLTAVAGAGEVNLRAMQDEWYQDVVPDDFSNVLRNGVVWTQEGANGECAWSLSGRELYVLADRPDISGYVSQPCLDLGRDHVVLCTEPLRSCVEEAIRNTGAQPSSVLDESFGAPPGWLIFRGVVPTAPVSAADDADIFNALRPLPKIEISLERGIRLGYANWLDGHPPSIRVYGDPEHVSEVRIDGQVAERGGDGAYRASGWDSVGAHSAWCAGTSRSYSIVPFEASWELWDAYAFPVAVGETQVLAVCGPLVRAAANESWGPESLSIPESNPVLLGPEPGQIVMAVRAFPLLGAPRIASPRFRPIWALPCDPLHCEKKTTRILLVARDEPLKARKNQGGGPNSGTDADIVRWCQLILNASRKGMSTDPDTEPVRALWLSYKHLARRIWRSRR